MRLIGTALIALVLTTVLFATSRAAEEAPVTATDIVAVQPTVPDAPAATEPAPPVPPTDLLEEIVKLKDEIAGYKTASSKKLAVFAIIMLLSNILINILKKVSDKTSKWKRQLVLVSLGLGVVAGVCTVVVAGKPIMDAIFYGAAGPLAVFLHELTKKGETLA